MRTGAARTPRASVRGLSGSGEGSSTSFWRGNRRVLPPARCIEARAISAARDRSRRARHRGSTAWSLRPSLRRAAGSLERFARRPTLRRDTHDSHRALDPSRTIQPAAAAPQQADSIVPPARRSDRCLRRRHGTSDRERPLPALSIAMPLFGTNTSRAANSKARGRPNDTQGRAGIARYDRPTRR